MGWSPLSQRRQASVGTPTPTSCMIPAERPHLAHAALAAAAPPRTLPPMEFGWWEKDDAGAKWQINVRFHGGNVLFRKKTGHPHPWIDFDGNDEQWDRLIQEAEKRLPRRLMSQKEFERLKAQRPH